MRYDYIFFDSGGTLFDFPNKGITLAQVAAKRVERVHALLTTFGVSLDFAVLDGAIQAEEKTCPATCGEAYTHLRLLQAVVARLALPLGAEETACLADAYAGPRYATWLFPGTVAALAQLASNGCRMGIIANTAWCGFSMDRAFAGVGLLPYLHVRLYSGDLGIAKPDVRIFRLAERLVNLSGKRLLYVGNDLSADIRGAGDAGWSTAFRRGKPPTTDGLADFEFDHIDELVSHCHSAYSRVSFH